MAKGILTGLFNSAPKLKANGNTYELVTPNAPNNNTEGGGDWGGYSGANGQGILDSYGYPVGSGYQVGRRSLGGANSFEDVLFDKDGKFVKVLANDAGDDANWNAMALIAAAGLGAGALGAGAGAGAGAADAGTGAVSSGVAGGSAIPTDLAAAGGAGEAAGGAGSIYGGAGTYGAATDTAYGGLSAAGGGFGTGGVAGGTTMADAAAAGYLPAGGALSGIGATDALAAGGLGSAAQSAAESSLLDKVRDKIGKGGLDALANALVNSGGSSMAAASRMTPLDQMRADLPLNGQYVTSSRSTKTNPGGSMRAAMARGAAGENPIDDNGVQIGAIKALKTRIDKVKARIQQLQGDS